ncbi:ABC transporter ATP-binding protein [Actinomyces naeslundii]|nr:ABC transporter ATP-binding protein [Actinomyces naeslundii]
MTATTPAPPTVFSPEQDIRITHPVASPTPVSPPVPTASSPPSSRLVAPTAPEAFPTPTGELAVTTDDLTRSYNGVNVVDEVNLRVPAGGVYGLLGPNGAGKSTTLKLLLGLIHPTSGRISVLNSPSEPRHSPPPGAIGSLIENPSYYPSLTGRENLAMMASYLGLPNSRVTHALNTVHLSGHENTRVRRYSTGMKRRLGLAMALLTDPPLMLLDEPTNGLDPASAAEVRQIIAALAHQEGMTMIISTHVLPEIEQLADTVGILCAGHLRYQGPLSGLDSDGVIELAVSAPTAVSTLLTSLGVVHEVRGGIVRTAIMPDADIGRLIASIVSSGTAVYRVQTALKTREQAFLELVYSTHAASAP